MDEKQKSVEISIVIPIYNEEANLKELHTKLIGIIPSITENYEIIFVDDASTDDSFGILKEINKEDKKVKVIKFRRNFGQSAAISAGFDHSKGDVIITMDGDLQNDPEDIPKLLEKLEKEDYDVVCGWRFDRADSVLKKAFSRMANRLRRRFTAEDIHDSGCTLRVYKKECLYDLELYGEMHRYIPALLLWKGYKIGEAKVRHHKRMYGKTKYTWKRVVKGFLDLTVVIFWQKFSARPIHIFGGLGLVLSIVGGIVGLYLVISRLFFGVSLTDRPLFMVAIFMVVIGSQFVVSGVLADIMLKVYYGLNERKQYLVEAMVE
uniref:Undecaprenyl-phosphate 4-deoxy-4-formamido-L-arabinose transferase n=1 Tax=Candidatus Methanogaster sp. ANME-2c ERB4 TaxID=2759911 RepID=A0A7G9Y180_9EURY|nr:undecaprenyl-phosphate 4-deoxy-4-formamido-L-arabinose transferase [Methanosarcinales archaeon ANME-2c ERB4]QNO42741.1 undecaprenyl-phosphate 4-deoxy-4-formamido-L-arabinose transferase [Methanosarcinales archaeon ANME-2c ERB4]